MKRILLALMLGIGVLGFAQSEEEIVQKYIVDKIKGYKPTDLVPYSKDGKKWALMDVKSRKILTDFVLRSPSTFNPDLHVDIYIYIEGYGDRAFMYLNFLHEYFKLFPDDIFAGAADYLYTKEDIDRIYEKEIWLENWHCLDPKTL